MDAIVLRENHLQFSNSPNYSFIFGFENEYNHETTLNWMNQNWTISIHLACIYLVFTLGLNEFMFNREPLNTKPCLLAWNITMAIFSILGAARSLPEFVYTLREMGVRHSICDASYLSENRITSFWAFAFIVSKAPELVDTLLLILRKQNLTLLHVAHRTITLVCSWFIYKQYSGIIRWFITMSYCMHSVIYTYFVLKSMNVKLPKLISMTISMAEVVQILLGFCFSVNASILYYKGERCQITKSGAIVSVAVYMFFVLLIMKYFIDSYIANKKTDKQKKKKIN